MDLEIESYAAATHGLNPEQLAAATSPLDAHVRVVASPGSGKSRTLVARVIHLLRAGVPGDRVKVVTFSRQAAGDIGARLPTEVGVFTIHALAYRFQAALGAKKPLQHGVSLIHSDFMPDERDAAEDNACGPFFSVDEHVYMFKRRLETDDGLQIFKELGEIDFLLVDEAQDLDPLQWSIVRILASRFGTRVFMAGDPNQNVYGFRRSSSEFLLSDMLQLPRYGCVSFELSTNYRSTRPIVAFCNSIMPNCGKPGAVHMTSARGSGPMPVLACFAYKAHELDYVLSRILELLTNGESAWDIAVLSRTQKDCFSFCHKLTEHGIVARVVTGDTDHSASSRTYPPSITVCTFHGAKGLEWNHVFVIGAHDNFNRRLMTREEEAQEANLFYVAATRAKNSLTFTSPQKIYTRRLSRPTVQEFYRALGPDPSLRIVAPQGLLLPGGDPYAKSVRSVTHFVKHAPGEVYARLKEQRIVPTTYPGATYKKIHSPHSYPGTNPDSAGLYALFVERAIQRQVDAACRAAIVRLGADPGKVWSMKSTDSHANHCFLYVEDRHMSGEDEIARRVSEKASEFGLPPDMVRVVSTDEQLPAYVLAQDALYRGASPFRAFYESRTEAIRARYKAFVNHPSDPTTPEGTAILSDVAMCAFLAYAPARTHLLFSKESMDASELSEFNRGLFRKTFELFGGMIEELLQRSRAPEHVPEVATNELYMSCLGVGFDMDVSSRSLHGICDLYIDKTIVDIKCSADRTSSISMQWVLQLLCYCALARKRNIAVDNIAIYNPIKGTMWKCPVDSWDGDSELLDIVDELMSAELGTALGSG